MVLVGIDVWPVFRAKGILIREELVACSHTSVFFFKRYFYFFIFALCEHIMYWNERNPIFNFLSNLCRQSVFAFASYFWASRCTVWKLQRSEDNVFLASSLQGSFFGGFSWGFDRLEKAIQKTGPGFTEKPLKSNTFAHLEEMYHPRSKATTFRNLDGDVLRSKRNREFYACLKDSSDSESSVSSSISETMSRESEKVFVLLSCKWGSVQKSHQEPQFAQAAQIS